MLRSHRHALWFVLALSGVVNLLMLTGAIYMLQVYDRVLLSRSGATLLFVTLIMLVLYGALYVFDAARQRILSLVGRQIEEELSQPLFSAALRMPLHTQERDKQGYMMRDLEEVGRFMSGSGLVAILDLPWMPLFVVVCFLFHPLIGYATIAAMLTVIALTVIGESLAKKPTAEVTTAGRVRQTTTDAAQRRAEVIAAMGFERAMTLRFATASKPYFETSTRLAALLITIGGITRTFRLAIQSLLLGIAAWLVINDQATPGVMIASSIVASRALAPVDQLVGRWRSITQARDSWSRIVRVLGALPPEPETIDLPMPSKEFTVENLWAAPPGSKTITLRNVTFRLGAGDILGVIGPSGSGKSTLARAITGIWQPVTGQVRVDGALLEQFPPDQRARLVGYLPQDVQLIGGTVAANVARFDPAAEPPAIIEAAKLAETHELILGLSSGYATDVGEDGLLLSGGQRQRIGLARALYKNPFILVLDEPNSNLDSHGEKALSAVMRQVSRRGGITIIVAHRMSTLEEVDKLMLIVDGQMKLFGDRDQVLAQMQNGQGGVVRTQQGVLSKEPAKALQDAKPA